MNKMKKDKFNFTLIFFYILFISLFSQCKKNGKDLNVSNFNFPEIAYIDSTIYEVIKVTCDKYWDLNKMIDSTFKVLVEGDEYVIQCDGYVDNQLYLFVIRVDKNGKWINDGRSVRKQGKIKSTIKIETF
jgi:hypothetical protein